MTSSTSSSPLDPVDLLILGAGWTSTFLVPHLDSVHPNIRYQTTTRDGRNGSIKWNFDPESDDPSHYDVLPKAKTVLITFPIKGEGGSRNLVRGYEKSKQGPSRWIQLGSTGIWDGGPTLIGSRIKSTPVDSTGNAPPAYVSSPSFKWTDRHSPYDKTNARAIAEDELLSLSEETFVLNLSGLWGGERDPSNWISRIASSKAALEVKGSLHLIHGLDVARAILAVHLSPPVSSSTTAEIAVKVEGQKAVKNVEEKGARTAIGLKGKRYILTDLRCIDWWDLASRYPSRTSTQSEETPQPFEWVQELMKEHNVKALPRTPQELGRALDSREFWEDFGLMPIKGSYEKGRL